ncbi:hypothetical protein Bca4012_037579 [Brassica carinata]
MANWSGQSEFWPPLGGSDGWEALVSSFPVSSFSSRELFGRSTAVGIGDLICRASIPRVINREARFRALPVAESRG